MGSDACRGLPPSFGRESRDAHMELCYDCSIGVEIEIPALLRADRKARTKHPRVFDRISWVMGHRRIFAATLILREL
jgi:hypothetical protein